jgi:hypothetical protein
VDKTAGGSRTSCAACARGCDSRRLDPVASNSSRVRETLNRLRGLAAALQREFFAALSETEMAELHALLRKLAEARIVGA